MKNILIIIGLLFTLSLNAQVSFSIPLYGFHLYSPEGYNQGKGYEYGLSIQYRQIDNPGYFLRTQFTWSPLSIYNEQNDSMISYVEKTLSLGLGGTFIIDERQQDYLHLALNIGRTSVSNSLFVGFSFIFEGVDLVHNSKHHKLQIELMPSIITGFGNISSHLQLKGGIAYKF